LDGQAPICVRPAWLSNSLAVAALVAVVIVACWPVVPVTKMAHEIQYGDATIWTHVIAWRADTWWRPSVGLFDYPGFFPQRASALTLDPCILPAVLVTPVWLVSHSFALTYNSATYLALFTTLLCTFLVLRRVTGNSRIVCLAAAVFASVQSDYYWHSSGHANLLWTGFVPLGFLGGHHCARDPRPRTAVMAAVAVASSVLVSWYLLVFSGIAAVAGWVVAVAVERPPLSRKTLFTLLGFGLLTLVLVAPLAKVYSDAAQGLPPRTDLEQAHAFSATLRGWILPPDQPARLRTEAGRWLADRGVTSGRGEDCQFVGFAMMLLLAGESLRLLRAAALHRFGMHDRFSVCCLAIAGLAVWLSAGPYRGNDLELDAYYYVHKLILAHTGFFRVPSRFAFLFHFFAAASLCVLLSRIERKVSRAARAALVVLPALAIAEHWPIETPPRYTPGAIEAIRRIDKYDESRKEAFVLLPDPRNCGAGLSAYPGWRPMANGDPNAPLFPKFHALMDQLQEFPSRRSIEALDKSGIRWIVASKDLGVQCARVPGVERVYSDDLNDLFRIRNPGTSGSASNTSQPLTHARPPGIAR
jgi:hypothetical protein